MNNFKPHMNDAFWDRIYFSCQSVFEKNVSKIQIDVTFEQTFFATVFNNLFLTTAVF